MNWWNVAYYGLCFFQGQMLRLEIPNILYRIGSNKYGHEAMGAAIEMHGQSNSIRANWNALKSLKECRHVHFYQEECSLCFLVNGEEEA